MKKILHFNLWRTLLLAIVALLSTSPGWAALSVEGIAYQVSGDGTAANPYIATVSSIAASSTIATDFTQGSTSITIPNTFADNGNNYTVTAIGANAFKGCTKVQTIYVPSTVTTIAGDAFKECTALVGLYMATATAPTFTDGTIPSNCYVYVKDNAALLSFGNIAGWKNYPKMIVLNQEGISIIDLTNKDFKFTILADNRNVSISGLYNAGELTYHIPATVSDGKNTYNVTTIAANAFTTAAALKSLVIPSTIKIIKGDAFYGASKLSYIKFDGSLPILDGVIINHDVTEIVLNTDSTSRPSGFTVTNLPITDSPGNYISIKDVTNALKTNLIASSAGFPSARIKQIGKTNSFDVISINGVDYWTYYYADDSIRISFPAVQVGELSGSVTINKTAEIGPGCFNSYNKISSFTFNNILAIGKNAFMTGSKLSPFAIPSSVTKIVPPLFDDASMPDKLIMLGTNPPVLYTNYYTNIDSTQAIGVTMTGKSLQVPYSARANYQGKNYDPAKTSKDKIWGQYTAFANEIFTSGDFTYEVLSESTKGGTVALTGVVSGSKDKYVFAIPETVTYNGKTDTIVEIGDGSSSAFSGCDNVVSLEIPKYVLKVNDNSLKGMNGLEYLIFPENLKEVGNNIENADNVNIFLKTSSTKFGTQTNTFGVVTYLGSEPSASNLPSALYTKLYKAGADGSYTYDNNYWYNKISADSTLITRVKDLSITTAATLPSKLDSLTVKGLIGTFKNCTALKELELPASYSTIGDYTFDGCDALTKVVYNQTTPPKEAKDVFGATPSTSLYLYVPKGTKSAYLNLTNPVNDYNNVPQAQIIEAGGVDATFEVDGIKYMVTKTGTDKKSFQAKIIGVTDKTKTYYNLVNSVKPFGNDTTYIVKIIGDTAFQNCTNVLTIIVPDSVEAIATKNGTDYAPFKGCSSLRYVVLPKGLKFLGSNAFVGLSNLEFYTTATEKNDDWVMPTSYSQITVPTGTKDKFEGYKANAVGDEGSIYYADGVWYRVYNAKDSKIAAINPVDMSSTSLNIAANVISSSFTVEKIENSAFKNSFLTNVSIPSTMKTIEGYAFKDSKLTSVTIPASVDTIGTEAFYTQAVKNLTSYTTTLKSVYAKNENPCKFHTGDKYLPESNVDLYVPSTASRAAYIAAKWEGYTASFGNIIAQSVSDTTVRVVISKDSCRVYLGGVLQKSLSKVISFTNGISLGDLTIDSLIINTDTTAELPLTLSNITLKTPMQIYKNSYIGLALSTSNDISKGIVNNGTIDLTSSTSELGTITNNGTMQIQSISKEYNITNNGAFKDLTEKTRGVAGTATLKIGDIPTISITSGQKGYLTIKTTADPVANNNLTFQWQKLNTKTSGWENVVLHTSTAASATDTLNVSAGGYYRCIATDSVKILGKVVAWTSLVSTGSVSEVVPAKTFSVTLPTIDHATTTPNAGLYRASEKDEFTFVVKAKPGFTNKYLKLKAIYTQADSTATLKPISTSGDSIYTFSLVVTDSIIVKVTDSVKSTAVGEIESGVKVWGAHGVLHITTPTAVTVYVGTFDGRVRAVATKAGEQAIPMPEGLYFVRIKNQTWKVKL